MIQKKSISVSLRTLFILTLLSTILFMGIEKFKLLERKGYQELKRRASINMQSALEEIKRVKIERGIPIEKEDIHSTGIIGPEFSPLVTTMGLLSAKRTAANPNFAGLLVEMFLKAGVSEGDVATFGLSGSFPSLNIASLVAADILKLKPIVISSIGSSKWGATNPEMTWLDMENILYKKGLISTKSIAASVTGGKNQAFLLPEGYKFAKATILRNNVPLIEERDLSVHVQRRLNLYEAYAGGKPIKIFVNVGGPLVDIGGGESRREIPSGLLLHPMQSHHTKGEGIIAMMLRRRIPVIHLLNINGLAKRYDLPVDPDLFPTPH